MVNAFLAIVIAWQAAQEYRNLIDRLAVDELGTLNRSALLAAICDQESRFKEKAVSPTNAKGLCQFTTIARKQVCILRPKQCGFNPFNAVQSLKAAAILFHHYTNYFKSSKYKECKLLMAVYSYNGGPSYVIKVYSRNADKREWERGLKKETRLYGPQVLQREKLFIARGWNGEESC